MMNKCTQIRVIDSAQFRFIRSGGTRFCFASFRFQIVAISQFQSTTDWSGNNIQYSPTPRHRNCLHK